MMCHNDVSQSAVIVARNAAQETPWVEFGRYLLTSVDKDITVKGSMQLKLCV